MKAKFAKMPGHFLGLISFMLCKVILWTKRRQRIALLLIFVKKFMYNQNINNYVVSKIARCHQ